GRDRQIDAIQRNRAEEALSEASDLDCGRRVGRHGGSLVWEFRGLAHAADAKFSRNVGWLRSREAFACAPMTLAKSNLVAGLVLALPDVFVVAGEVVAGHKFVVLAALAIHVLLHDEKHRLEEMRRLLPGHGADHGVHGFVAEERARLRHAG